MFQQACARNLGLTSLPIVCVSVENFYQSFHEMLQRAYSEGLVKNPPDKVVHFVPTAEEAVRWIEQQKEKQYTEKIPTVRKRSSVLRGTQSFISPPIVSRFSRSFSRSSSGDGLTWRDGKSVDLLEEGIDWTWSSLAWTALPFVAGLAVGLLSGTQLQTRR